MTPFRRVLVTGSSSWTDEQALADELLEARQHALQDGAGGIRVVHGARPSGADAMAAEWCAAHDVPAEPHPADWETHGRDASHLRDRAMVGAGADLCLVFIGPCTSATCRRPKPHDSHDAHACAELAERAGIPVRKRTA
ncbi:SLOG family protein [Streptomyces winkii]|uniref:SLOG family protein n=1 Tax=Streptomyces winkii TaxID=3051178 RepID=UPI0028D8AEDF|nr:SLOG family protein [Streptomyces sp. DSM 40971]